MPFKSRQAGGRRARGPTEEAGRLVMNAPALDKAGVCAMVFKCIPEGVAKKIAKGVKCSIIEGCQAVTGEVRKPGPSRFGAGVRRR